jgi:hypothetical protein
MQSGDPLVTALAVAFDAFARSELGAMPKETLLHDPLANPATPQLARELFDFARMRACDMHGERELGRQLAESLVGSHDVVYRCAGLGQLAIWAIADGELDKAAKYVGDAIDGAGKGTRPRSISLASAAQLALAQGKPEAALEYADAILELTTKGPGFPLERSRAHRARVEALEALGRADDAAQARREARARLDALASSMPEAYREGFLKIPVHQEILAHDGGGGRSR